MMRNTFRSSTEEKTPFYLRITDVLASIYTLLGVDYKQMRTILKMKMTVDSRREAVLQGTGNTQKGEGEEKNQFFSSLWVYTLLSSFFIVLFVYDNWVFQYTTYFSFVFIMVFSTMLANFSTILLDVKDSTLIGTKPVSSKTIGAAKATQIGIYLISFTLAIGLPIIVFTFYFNGILAGILLLLLTFLATLWCLGLTIVMYATVLKKFDGERLKNIIAYSQIVLSIVMVFSYYIMGQLFEVIDPETLLLEMNVQLGHIVLFPMWFVAPFGLLQEGLSTVYLIYTLLLIVGTIVIGLLFYTHNDKIEQNLQKMSTSQAKVSTRSIFEKGFAKIFCFDAIEKAYFHFSWQLTKEEREFKTRIYPSLVSAFVFPAVILFQELSGDGAGSPFLLGILPYFSIMLIPMLAVSIQFSSQYKGKWVFDLSPVHARPPFLRAATKVMLIKILLPVYFAISLVVIFLTGPEYIIQHVNGFLFMMLLMYVETQRTCSSLPFSKKFGAAEANKGCMATFIFFVPVFLIAGGVILLQTFYPFTIWIIFLLLIGGNVWWMRNGFQSKRKINTVTN